MSQLTKGVYTEARHMDERGPFGLKCGQFRDSLSRICHSAYWYNQRGEKIGYGDLALGDIGRISRDIERGELFIALTETSVHGGYDVLSPGTIAQHALYVIAKNEVSWVYHYGGKPEETRESRGLIAKVITEQELVKLMAQEGE